MLVRLVIARLCDSKKDMWSFWRLLGDMGYMIRGLVEGGFDSLMTMLLGVSCSWTGSGRSFG